MARPTEISTQTFRAPSPDQHDALQEYGLSLSLSLSLARARALSLCMCMCVCVCVRACVRASLSLSLSLSLSVSLSFSLSLSLFLSFSRSLASARAHVQSLCLQHGNGPYPCGIHKHRYLASMEPLYKDYVLQRRADRKSYRDMGTFREARILLGGGTWAHSVRLASFLGRGSWAHSGVACLIGYFPYWAHISSITHKNPNKSPNKQGSLFGKRLYMEHIRKMSFLSILVDT